MLLGKNEGLVPLMPLDVCYYQEPLASVSFCDYKGGLFHIYFFFNEF